MEKTYDIIYSVAGEVYTEMRVGQSKIDNTLFRIKNLLGGRIIAIYESSDNIVNEFI